MFTAIKYFSQFDTPLKEPHLVALSHKCVPHNLLNVQVFDWVFNQGTRNSNVQQIHIPNCFYIPLCTHISLDLFISYALHLTRLPWLNMRTASTNHRTYLQGTSVSFYLYSMHINIQYFFCSGLLHSWMNRASPSKQKNLRKKFLSLLYSSNLRKDVYATDCFIKCGNYVFWFPVHYDFE